MSFAERLRRETAGAHRAAERAAVVGDLLGGRLALADYVCLARQYVEIYATLERLETSNREPSLAPFLLPGLHRTAALHADLAALAGARWADDVAVLAATDAYCAQIDASVGECAELLLAHHYVRYLGDLSGGQAIGRALRRTYGLAGHTGTAFYRFPALASPETVKDGYRASLDRLEWDATRQQRLVDEVAAAYRHHAAIFDQLDAYRAERALLA